MKEEIFNSSIPNREIMGKAISFHDAANILWSKDKLDSPFISCASFSIELYIKCLNARTFCDVIDYNKDEYGVEHYKNMHAKSNCRGHGLLGLFDNLSEELKSDLRNFYQSSEYPNEYESLDSILEHVNNSFVDFRYSFEKNISSLNITALYKLCNILYHFVFGLYEKNR
tara:strand:- start:468 stop:977 length:510 start_codon:yes stop_codon:yes gene_type:complete